MKNTVSLKSVFIGLWLAAFPLVIILWYYPVITFRIRVETLLMALFIVVGSICATWKYTKVRWPLIAFYVTAVVFLVFPVQPPRDRSALRTAYGDALKAYSGTRYVWGGEGRFGIDCSGLVRKGLEDALASQGFSTLNPALVRESNSLYWNDTTAKVIGDGYSGRTGLVTTCPSLNSLDYSLLLPGDLAVTMNGVHVMAYLGDKTWIAADPGEGKVTRFVIPEKTNAYFSMPMNIIRWKILTDLPAKN